MRRFRLPLALTALCLALGACAPSGDEAPARPSDATDAKSTAGEAPVDIIVAEELGGFEGALTGLGFWTHPSLSFNGLLLVADGGGIRSYNIEDGAPVDKLAIDTPRGLGIGYAGAGPGAAGHVVTRSGAAFVVAAIDNAARTFAVRDLAIDAPDVVDGFCVGGDPDADGFALHAFGGGALASFSVTPTPEGGLAARRNATRPAPRGALACAVDDLDGSVFALAADGAIVRYAPGAEEPAAFASPVLAAPAGISLALAGLDRAEDAEACCGHVAVLDGADGSVHVFDREDASRLGAVRVGRSFDVDAVDAAAGFAVGYGNFGGAFRDGVLAHLAEAADAGGGVVRLSAWSGVLNALGLPIGASANPRSLRAQPEDDAVVIDIDVVGGLPPATVDP